MTPETERRPLAFRRLDISLEDLARDYEFTGNLYLGDGMVHWTNIGGGSADGPLDNFLCILCMDNNRAFGPIKKQKGWTLKRLEEYYAVGVYKLKSRNNPGKNTKGT